MEVKLTERKSKKFEVRIMKIIYVNNEITEI